MPIDPVRYTASLRLAISTAAMAAGAGRGLAAGHEADLASRRCTCRVDYVETSPAHQQHGVSHCKNEAKPVLALQLLRRHIGLCGRREELDGALGQGLRLHFVVHSLELRVSTFIEYGVRGALGERTGHPGYLHQGTRRPATTEWFSF